MNIERKHARAIREILKRTDTLMDEVFDIPNFDNYKEASKESVFNLQTSSVLNLDTIAASVADSLS